MGGFFVIITMMYLKKKTYLVLLIFTLVLYMGLMILFTFYDYKITNALYNPQTGFGMIFEAIGPMFMPFFMIYSTVGLIILLNLKEKLVKCSHTSA